MNLPWNHESNLLREEAEETTPPNPMNNHPTVPQPEREEEKINETHNAVISLVAKIDQLSRGAMPSMVLEAIEGEIEKLINTAFEDGKIHQKTQEQLLIEQTRAEERARVRKAMEGICHTASGENGELACKYWDVTKFGYAPDDRGDAPTDKFFPQEVLDFLIPPTSNAQ